jgi:hypothetical protein
LGLTTLRRKNPACCITLQRASDLVGTRAHSNDLMTFRVL